MPISLVTLIARTQAAIDGETDPKKLRPLQANLAAFLATKAEMDDDDGDGDEDDEDSKSKKAAAAAAKAKGKAEAAKHRAKAAEHKAKAAEAEEAAKKAESEGEEDEDEEESEEAAALAAPGHEALLAKLAASVTKIEQTQVANTRTALVAGARKLGAITKTEAAWLDTQPLASVESFLQMRSKAGLVITNEGSLVKPKDAQPGTEASLPDETKAMIESAVAAYPGDRKAFRETLVKAHLEAHTKQLAAAMNGAPGRY